ncbi:hypothetical protein BSKO_12346 [Bryopsis sp. KO-2023]|nr:hypothetical protein BSKO_12346 [Bryopsis sp. KO-2023]
MKSMSHVLLAASIMGLLSWGARCELPPPKGVIEGTGNTVGYGELKEEWRGEVIQISWAPRAFLLKNFLSMEECEYLKAQATPSMTKSTVVDNDTGKSVPSNIRTSTGTFLNLNQDDKIAKIEKRVAQVTMIPVAHQEGFQILRYVNGQKYEPHYDFFHDDFNTKKDYGGQRIMTVLMYLSTPTEGGETVFPKGDRKMEGPEWSKCAKEGLSVKAYKGDAIMFYSLKPDGSEDPTSLHGSCPTLAGEKWSATKWIHVLPFGMDRQFQQEKWDNCADKDDGCAEWAAAGECEKNAVYMHRMCRKSCGSCKPGSKT